MTILLKKNIFNVSFEWWHRNTTELERQEVVMPPQRANKSALSFYLNKVIRNQQMLLFSYVRNTFINSKIKWTHVLMYILITIYNVKILRIWCVKRNVHDNCYMEQLCYKNKTTMVSDIHINNVLEWKQARNFKAIC